MDRRALLRLAGTTALALGTAPLLGGCATPASAVAAWRPGVTDDDLLFVLAHALLAPNPHNRQPWLIDRLSESSARLNIDLTRLLPETDPFGRQIVIGTGAFVELAALAASARGFDVDVDVDGSFGAEGSGVALGEGEARAVATLTLRRSGRAVDPLFAAIPLRHTHRGNYDGGVSDEDAADLTAAAGGVRVDVVTDAAKTAEVRALANEAWRAELTTARTMMESMRLLRVGTAEIEAHRDGLTITDPMLVAFSTLGLFDRSQPPAADSSVVAGQLRDFDERLTATPAFFALMTTSNDRRAQLAAGRACARAMLAATTRGLVMQPISQALQEFAEVSGPYARAHALLAHDVDGQRETVQMLCRLGRATPAEPAPRRGLSSLLRT